MAVVDLASSSSSFQLASKPWVDLEEISLVHLALCRLDLTTRSDPATLAPLAILPVQLEALIQSARNMVPEMSSHPGPGRVAGAAVSLLASVESLAECSQRLALFSASFCVSSPTSSSSSSSPERS